MKLLGALEKPFYRAVNPVVESLIRAGVRPNTITTIGTGLVLVSAVAYGMGHIRIGGLLLLLSGVADTLDGQVARGGAMVTRFGAFYDSTLDRVGDGATFIGIGAFLLTAPDVAQPDRRGDRLHGRDPQLAPGLLRPGPGRRIWDWIARSASPSGRSGFSASAWPHCWWGRGRGRWCSRGSSRSWRWPPSSPWSSGSCTSTGPPTGSRRRRPQVPPSPGVGAARGAAGARHSRERTLAVAEPTARRIAPAEGKLGVLCVGLGAVATTFIAGVENIRRGAARPIGSLTQMGTIRLGKRTEGRAPLIRDFVSLASLTDLVFGAWDPVPDDAYTAAVKAGVLDRHEHLEPIAGFLKAIKPMPAAFDQQYVKRLGGKERQVGQDQAGAGRGAAAGHPRLQEQERLQPAGHGLVRLDRDLHQPGAGPLDAGRLRAGDGRERPVDRALDALRLGGADGRGAVRERRSEPHLRLPGHGAAGHATRAWRSAGRTSRPARP